MLHKDLAMLLSASKLITPSKSNHICLTESKSKSMLISVYYILIL